MEPSDWDLAECHPAKVDGRLKNSSAAQPTGVDLPTGCK